MKKLCRLRRGALLFGVCAGVGEYFRLDPTLVRLAAVLLTCLGTAGFWLYLAAAIILPPEP